MLSWLLACTTPTPWTVTAVQWAGSRDVAVDRLVVGGTGTVDMAWSFFVARRGDQVVLIDAGTNRMAEKAAEWDVVWWSSPVEALEPLGIRPDQVTDVILTHDHWDHADGAGLFPSAHVWRPPEAPSWPGLAVEVRGQHTPGHRVVLITCADRTVAVAGDGIYLYANLELGLPTTVSRDPAGGLAEMRELATRAEVLPNHDPALYTRYPHVAEHAVSVCGAR